MLAELGTYLTSLPDNPPPAELHTIKLAPVNISNVWGDINDIVAASGKYVMLDLSGCYATDNMVSGQSSPTDNDMNVIRDTPNIKGIVLPSSLTSIGGHAFYGCSGLDSITIPLDVTSTGVASFYYCSSLISITIPPNVTDIGPGTFDNCSGLTSVTIPFSVTSIGYRAFEDCSNLTSVIFETGSNIAGTNFGNDAFPEGIVGGVDAGNTLRSVYQAVGGGAGTYIWDPGVNNWTKQ